MCACSHHQTIGIGVVLLDAASLCSDRA